MTEFKPLPLLGNPHVQTLVASLVSLAREPRSERRMHVLPDGDQLALEVSQPAAWRAGEGTTAVLVHGLTGSHQSSYMRRLAGKLVRRGWRVARVNLRDSGSGEGLAKRPYHGGCSADIRSVVEALRPECERLVVAGFSLGGNIVLKLAGELGADADGLVDSVVALCPAADLRLCVRRIMQPQNRLYEKQFVKELCALARRRHARYPELGPFELRDDVRILEYDDRYVAQVWGFQDAYDYYERASAKPHLHRIEVPTQVLLADDDPIIDPAVLDEAQVSSAVQVTRSPRGGHLGFLGRTPRHGVQWMDLQIFRAWGLS